METKKEQEVLSQSQKTIYELNKTMTELDIDIQSLRSQFKEIEKSINDFRVDLFTDMKESKKKEQCASTTRPEPKKFQDPFAFFTDMSDKIGEDAELLNICYSMLADFLDEKLSANILIRKMKLLFKEPSDLIFGLRLFLNTPAAISSARTQFKDNTFLSIMVGMQFGYGSQKYLEYLRIVELYEKSNPDVSELDSQLDALFEVNGELKKAVKRSLENGRDSAERASQ